MTERILTPVQNAIFNLVAETDYDPAISEATKNETFADIMADYRTYNRIFQPMTLEDKVAWYEKAWKEAAKKVLFWTERLSKGCAVNHPEWRENQQFWIKQKDMYIAERTRLRKMLNEQVSCNG